MAQRIQKMEKNKMSTQLKFRDRACRPGHSIAKLVADYPGFHISQLSLKFRVGAKVNSISPWVKPRADAPSLSNPLNIMAAHWGLL